MIGIVVKVSTIHDSAIHQIQNHTVSLKLKARAIRALGHQLNFFQLHPLDAEVCCHLGYLAGADEIFRVGAKLFHARLKLVASHALGYVEA